MTSVRRFAVVLSRAREDPRGPGRGGVVVVDRAGPAGEDRRLAGHRRRISEVLVKAEMAKAGFDVERDGPSPGEGRFAIVFRKRAGEQWVRASPRKVSVGIGNQLEEEL